MAAKEKETRATKFEMEQRVTQVIEWQLTGKTSFEVVQLGSAKWGLGERMVRKIIAKANRAIYESMQSTKRDHFLASKLHQLDGVIALSLKQNQPAAACAAIGMQCKLVGITSSLAS